MNYLKNLMKLCNKDSMSIDYLKKDSMSIDYLNKESMSIDYLLLTSTYLILGDSNTLCQISWRVWINTSSNS